MMDILNKNLFAKIVALIVAIVLWFFVMNEQNPAIDSSFTLPLEVTHAPEGYTVNRSVENIKLKVRGPRSLFAMATERDFKAYVDLSGVKEGRHSIKVQTVLPQGFDLVSVSPETIIFDIDKELQRNVNIDVAFSGTPDSGVTIGKAIPAVNSVTLEGASSAVNSVAKVVGYINLAGKNSDFTVDMPLVAVNNEGKEVGDVKLSPGSVKVSVSIVKGLYKKFVDIKPNLAEDLPAGYILNSVTLEPAKMDIYGDQRVVDTLEVLYTEKISLSDIDRPTTKQIKVQLPIGITVTNDTITAKIDIVKRKEEAVKKEKQ
ncbi:CdaR family protein [Anaerosinus massiliensis]|uniref:CdaR family protein n=1 Tax=Massilibacillus massiliensis TaxID=1806837 RepID=UPI000DA61EE9|nr:CdaR family protein [Massilibacillus massiliensis]